MGAGGPVRGLLFGVGAFLVVNGLASIPLGAATVAQGVWLVVVGSFLVATAIREHRRHRVAAAASGPGDPSAAPPSATR